VGGKRYEYDKKLPPENWQEAFAKLTELMEQILLEARGNTERLIRLEEDSAGRYMDLRKRIDRVDERIDTLNEQVLDFKRRVRSVEHEVADLRAPHN
jgi:chromosome segregation ATPase